MAKFGFDYQVDVEATQKQGGGDFALMPDMNALLEVSAAEVKPLQDGPGHEIALTIDVIEPEEFKGRKMWAYWTIDHPDQMNNKKYSFGKPRFDKLCRAVGVPDPEDTDDIILKQFVATVATNWGGVNPAGGRYKDKNEIVHWFYTDEDAPEPVPDVGIIEGGIPGRPKAPPAAANDNKPASRPAAAAPAREAGSKPWAKAKAA